MSEAKQLVGWFTSCEKSLYSMYKPMGLYLGGLSVRGKFLSTIEETHLQMEFISWGREEGEFDSI